MGKVSSSFQLLALSMGGIDGGIQQDSGDGAETGLTCHLLQVTSDTVFTALLATDADGNEVNMLTVNNLSGKTVTAPAVIGCPDINKGGFIKAVTMSSGQVFRHTATDTARS